MTRAQEAHADEVGYTNHTGFGGILGQNDNRHAFANAATLIDTSFETAAEAVQAAGLDWTVSKRPLWFTGKTNGSKPKKIDGAFAVVKDDDEQYLGTVGKVYHSIQNAEAFDWADMVPGKYVAGGAMRSNRNVYMIKQLDTVKIDAIDEHEMFLMLRSSHDGTKSLQAIATPVRIHCMNMMPIALKNAKFKFAVRHVTSYADKLAQASQIHGLVDAYAAEFAATTRQLAETSMLIEDVQKLLAETMPGRVELQRDIISNLQTSPTINDAHRGTAYGVLNAVTEFFEWRREVTSPAHALQANVDGQGARIRNAVAHRLLERGR